MGKIKKLEDLNAWKEATKLLSMIYPLLKKLPEEEKYNLKKHLMQCARNAPSNIAEGFGRFFTRDSVQFYRIAIGSFNEMKSDVHICKILKYFSKQEVEDVIKEIDKCLSITYGLIRSSYKNKETSSRSRT